MIEYLTEATLRFPLYSQVLRKCFRKASEMQPRNMHRKCNPVRASTYPWHLPIRVGGGGWGWQPTSATHPGPLTLMWQFVCFLMFSFFGDPLTPGPHHPKRHQQPPPKRPQQLPFKRPDADLPHSVFNVLFVRICKKSRMFSFCHLRHCFCAPGFVPEIRRKHTQA